MGDYYIERTDKTALTSAEIKDLKNNDVGFGSLIYGDNTDTNPKKYYTLGELMRSRLVTGDGETQSNLGGVFSMPHMDANGICNNMYGARFFEGAAQECAQ